MSDTNRDDLKSTHEVDENSVFPNDTDTVEENPENIPDDAPPSDAYAGPSLSPGAQTDGLHPCPVCEKPFAKSKALHGHMRSHGDRSWKGITPPSDCRQGSKHQVLMLPPEGAAAAVGEHAKLFPCHSCGKVFDSKQALGGHRASHKKVKGCSALAREGAGGSGEGSGTAGSGKGIGPQKKRGRKPKGVVIMENAGVEENDSGDDLSATKVIIKENEEEKPSAGKVEATEENARTDGSSAGRGYLLDLNLPPSPEDGDELRKDYDN